MSASYEDFLEALRQRESSGNYSAVNSLGYLGAYQFGEAALIDLGYVIADNNPYDQVFEGGWTGKNGIDSAADFLASPEAQDAAMEEWAQLLWSYLLTLGVTDYIGTTIKGVPVTVSGVIAGAHLAGAGGAYAWLSSQGDIDYTDGATYVSTYVAQFAGYEVGFETGYDWPGPIVEGLDIGEETTGSAIGDLIYGNGGDDTIDGSWGDDIILGGDGADEITGGLGDDVASGNAGNDLVQGGDGNDTLAGADGDDTVLGGDGDDNMGGGAGEDYLDGGPGNDTIGAGPDDDEAYGGDGEDFVAGGPGSDLLDGGADDDRINGGDGDDTLTGGTGADVFVFADGSGSDIITDFEDGSDRIDLIQVTGLASFTDLEGQITQVGDDAVIDLGDGNMVTLTGIDISDIGAEDFIFG